MSIWLHSQADSDTQQSLALLLEILSINVHQPLERTRLMLLGRAEQFQWRFWQWRNNWSHWVEGDKINILNKCVYKYLELVLALGGCNLRAPLRLADHLWLLVAKAANFSPVPPAAGGHRNLRLPVNEVHWVAKVLVASFATQARGVDEHVGGGRHVGLRDHGRRECWHWRGVKSPEMDKHIET